jgi:hypothetical protein
MASLSLRILSHTKANSKPLTTTKQTTSTEETVSEEDNEDNEVKDEDDFAFCSTRNQWDRDMNGDSINYSYRRETMENITLKEKKIMEIQCATKH